MAVSNIKAILQYDIHKVWEVTTIWAGQRS